jgi:hypothetical protein
MKRFAFSARAYTYVPGLDPSTLRAMPLPLIPGVFRVSITHAPGNAVSSTNVMHFFSSTLTADQVLTALNGAVSVGMFDQKLGALVDVLCVATELDGASPSAEATFSGGGWVGTSAGEVSPASSVIVTLRTSQRGKRHTGRVYLGTMGEDKMAGGQILPAAQATMQPAWTAFISNCSSAGIPLHVTSYGYTNPGTDPGNTRPSYTATTVPVVTATVQQFLATQRRRQSRLRQ